VFKLTMLSLTILIGLGSARAQNCVRYIDAQRLCTGPGCNVIVPDTRCTFGCISGTCNPLGNTADCCGVPHDYAQIFSDGGTCAGQDCGLLVIRRSEMRTRKFSTLADLEGTPPLALPLRRLFMPNKCTHDFVVAYEWAFLPLAKEEI